MCLDRLCPKLSRTTKWSVLKKTGFLCFVLKSLPELHVNKPILQLHQEWSQAFVSMVMHMIHGWRDDPLSFDSTWTHKPEASRSPSRHHLSNSLRASQRSDGSLPQETEPLLAIACDPNYIKLKVSCFNHIHDHINRDKTVSFYLFYLFLITCKPCWLSFLMATTSGESESSVVGIFPL